ncbi:hypothetical protein J437_LFUL012889 [Ladona fulva]|uniref:E3 ubiquitin-protein ligase n=1 Tax=Ladona fulva TaxID=123851 RepID=A0A8K0KCA4_LADFU|nr:hypothetical protein J437_LFUL012889 [Ladona fulva]
METVLRIAYRLDIKSWRIKKTQKMATEAMKKEVQEKLCREMNLLVDLPKQGYGSSNTGNVGRVFFQNPELASEVTGISKDLTERLNIILCTICSGFAINITAFEHFATETAKWYVQEYPWYMPQSVHKILIHGSLIIKEAIIPIGQLSEEALEAQNKDVRNFMKFNSRKFSWKENVEDIFHLLLGSSDPLITSMRRIKPKLGGSLPQSVLDLLETPKTPGWWQYDERTGKHLEGAYSSGESSCDMVICGALYVIDFENLVQYRKVGNGRRRRIKRDLATAEKKGIAGLT